MKLAFPVVILIAFIAFAAGLMIKNSFVSPYNMVMDKNTLQEESDAEIAQSQANLPSLNGNSTAASQVSEAKQLPNNSGSYTVAQDNDKVVINGNFRIPDFYKLNYNFIFPKNGGDVNGKITGVCEGDITGKSDKPDSDGEARIEGNFSGDCKPIPGLSFKTKASGTFEGQLKFKENKVRIIYILNEPYSTRGGFELGF